MNFSVNNLNFSSRNIGIKKADDIMRLVKNKFPYFSQTYQTMALNSLTGDVVELKKASNYLNRDCIIKLERLRDEYLDDSFDEYCTKVYDAVKRNGIANCGEISRMNLGALLSNGFDDATPMQLRVLVKVMDENGQMFDEMQVPYDHATVLTTVKNKKNKPMKIFVDGWLGKVMAEDEANREYLSLIKKYGYDDIKKEVGSRLKNGLDVEKCKLDCCAISYSPDGVWSNWDRREFQKQVNSIHPELNLYA